MGRGRVLSAVVAFIFVCCARFRSFFPRHPAHKEVKRTPWRRARAGGRAASGHDAMTMRHMRAMHCATEEGTY